MEDGQGDTIQMNKVQMEHHWADLRERREALLGGELSGETLMQRKGQRPAITLSFS